MKLSYKILKQYLKTSLTAQQIADKLDEIGHEVEQIDDLCAKFKDFVTARIVSAEKHPNADKLQICKVDAGTGDLLQIVCGAQNARAGIDVALAKVGAVMPSGLKIEKRKVRGEHSTGMICSASELELEGDDSGIMELSGNPKPGKDLAQTCGLDDHIITLGITPNRGDALCIIGIARDLAASGAGRIINRDQQTQKHSIDSSYSAFADSKLVPEFAWREIRGVHNLESAPQMQNSLRNIGIKPISLLVDAANYTTYITGRPLHIYDSDKISNQIYAKPAASSGLVKCLDDNEYKIEQGDIIICSAGQKEIYAIAGIMGDSISACSPATKNILIEAAIFDAEQIARTGRRLSIESDARYRFERSVDRQMTDIAVDMATQIILQGCKDGKISEIKKYSDHRLEQKVIEFDAQIIEEVIGHKIEHTQILSILKSLGFAPKMLDERITVEVPSWRHDVEIKEDIAEEILRIYGIDKIPERKLFLSSADFVENAPSTKYHNSLAIKRMLAGLGYKEIISYSFIDKQQAEHFGKINPDLEIVNPISSVLGYMRGSLLPGLLSALAANNARSISDLALFELGPVFEDTTPEGQKLFASGIMRGAAEENHPARAPKEHNIYDAKAATEQVLSACGINLSSPDIEFSQGSKAEFYHPGRSCDITKSGQLIARFGEIHPNSLKLFDLPQTPRSLAFEIDLSALQIDKKCKISYGDFKQSQYQPSKRDFAFIIDKSHKIGQVLDSVNNIDKQLIKGVNLFDIYSDDAMGQNKQSIAFSVLMQHDSQNLNQKELEQISDKIIVLLKKKFGASLRAT